MERFTFVSGHGKSIVIDYNGPYILYPNYEGLSSVEVIPRVTKGYKQIGNSLQDTSLGIRIITIPFAVAADSMFDTYSRSAYLGSVFNPLAGEGILNYENDAVSRSIRCSVTATPDKGERNGMLIEYTVELTAQQPLFFDPIETVRMVQDFVGGLRFPIRFNPAIRFARRGDALTTVITGDVPSPIRVEFRGGCTNPRITNVNTGEFIKIGFTGKDITLQEDEKLIVDTAYGNKTANLILADGSIVAVDDYIDDESTFFSLPVGSSKTIFIADAGSPAAYIAYRNWFTSGG